MTVQHAKVHSISISVLGLVLQDCTVTFHRPGGHITYPNDKQLELVIKEGVFFVALNVLPPGACDMFGKDVVFSWHGR